MTKYLGGFSRVKKWCIMNRRRGLAALAALLLLLGAGLFLMTRKAPHDRAAARALLTAAARGLNEYAVDAALHPEEGTLSVKETLRYTNGTGDTLETLVLRTYAGAYETEEFSPAATTELFFACYGEAFSSGGIALFGAWWNGEPVETAFLDEARTALSVKIGALMPGETGELKLNLVLTIPQCAHRFGVFDGLYRFGSVLPVLAPYENGAWRADEYVSIGAPFVSACANWTFALTLPDGYEALASAPLKRENGRLTGTLTAARDFFFAVSKAYETRTGAAKGVSLTAAAKTGAQAEAALKYMARAVETLTDLYGDAPYETLSLCLGALPFDGASYPGALLIRDDAKDEDALELLITREAARQWFGAKVGSDAFYAPWQDEALAEWALLSFVKARYGQTGMETLRAREIDEPMREHIGQTVTPGSPLDYFPDWPTYVAVARGRGAAMLVAADQMAGGRLDAFLRGYVSDFAFKTVSRADFERALNGFSGLDLSPLITDYIDTYMNN